MYHIDLASLTCFFGVMRLPVFCKVDELLDYVFETRDAGLYYHPSVPYRINTRISQQAKRKGISVSVRKIKSTNFVEVRYVGSVSAVVAKKALSSKTKVNTRHQSSLRGDWNPSDSLDPILGGRTLREIITEKKAAGGGTFKTTCKIHQIGKISREVGVKYSSKKIGGYRSVTILLK